MTTYLLSTLRDAARSPGPWVLLALGLLSGWGGLNLAVLALGSPGRQAPGLIEGTAQAWGVLAALWTLAGALDADRRSPLRTAADLTEPGAPARLLGRWGGAVLTGTLLGAAIATLLPLLAGVSTSPPSLYLASVGVIVLAAAWGLVLATVWPGGPIVLLGALLWFLGHLPWGRVVWLLPGPRPDADLARQTTITALAVAGLLALALGLTSRRART